MLYAGGHFIQTLEGPEEAVDATFARIQRDTRHRTSTSPCGRDPRGPSPTGRWASRQSSSDEAAELPGFNDYLEHARRSLPSNRKKLGHAGIFHRVFRDNMG